MGIEEDTEILKRLEEEATPRPWFVEEIDGITRDGKNDRCKIIAVSRSERLLRIGSGNRADAELIGEMRNLLPDILKRSEDRERDYHEFLIEVRRISDRLDSLLDKMEELENFVDDLETFKNSMNVADERMIEQWIQDLRAILKDEDEEE